MVNESTKKGVKNDNRLENLEWCTRSENIRHSIDILGNIPSAPINRDYGLKGADSPMWGKFGKLHCRSKPIKQLNMAGNIIKIWESLGCIKRELGFAEPNINKVCRGYRNTAYGSIWRYA